MYLSIYFMEVKVSSVQYILIHNLDCFKFQLLE